MSPIASKPAAQGRRLLLPLLAGTGIALAVVAMAMVASPYDIAAMAGRDWRLRAPDIALLARQGLAIHIHLAAAVAALAIGTVIMLRPKGVGLHKALGWTWVIAMAATAVSSFFIRGMNGGALSFIHLLSGWTIITLPIAVAAIRRRDVARHRRSMTSLFLGGLLIAGALTFIPGRLMWRVFFG